MAKQHDAENEVETDEAAGAMFENNEDGLVVSLGNVEAQKFEVLPARTYDVMIEDNEFQMSKTSNKPMWNLKLAVIDEEFENRKLFTFLSFSEKALPGTKTALAVIAPEMAESDIRVNDPETVASIVGRRARVKVGIEKSEEYGEQNRVKRWLPADENSSFLG